MNRHIVVDDVTIKGAGNWWTIIKGREVALEEPAPDGSVHTGVGFYGKDAGDGGSNNVHLANFAIEGDVRERIDTDQVNGVGGALSDSTIDGLYIHHTKVGLWFDGPMDNLTVKNTIVVNVIADAINFRRGVTNSRVENSFFRNTGDDAMAMWSHNVSTVAADENANNVYDHNTIQTPTLANGIAIYGGRDNTVSNNIVADPIREGSGLHAGQRFNSTPFAGYLRFTNNTTVRAGTYELNWHIGLGAIWLFALEGSLTADIEVTGDHYLHNTYNAIMLVADWPVKDLYSIENVSFKDVRIDGTGTSVLSARAMGSASFENVDARHVGAPVPWGDDRGAVRQQLRRVQLGLGQRLGVLDHRPGWQRLLRRSHSDDVAAGMAHAQPDHLQRSTARQSAATAISLVTSRASQGQPSQTSSCDGDAHSVRR